MATHTLPFEISRTQGPSVPVAEIGRIKSVLWARCSGCRFVGIQKAYGARLGDQILFQTPGIGPTTTLAVPVALWNFDVDVFVALVQHKILQTLVDFDIAQAKRGIRA